MMKREEKEENKKEEKEEKEEKKKEEKEEKEEKKKEEKDCDSIAFIKHRFQLAAGMLREGVSATVAYQECMRLTKKRGKKEKEEKEEKEKEEKKKEEKEDEEKEEVDFTLITYIRTFVQMEDAADTHYRFVKGSYKRARCIGCHENQPAQLAHSCLEEEEEEDF